jgi:C-terminal processing protease CtpA/Prc
MKQFTLFLIALLIFSFSLNLYSADQKKVEKKIWVKTTDKKSGLGVVVSSATKSDEQTSERKGAKIVEVFKASEADMIGLKKGDLIIGLNDKEISEPSDLLEIMENAEEGEEINLTVLRDGKDLKFKATLKPFNGGGYAFHTGDHDNMLFDFHKAPHAENFTKVLRLADGSSTNKKGGYLGVQVKNISEQLRAYFEVKSGVLVEEVMKASPAEDAGLKAGDVITKINDRNIEDPEDLVRTINYFNPEEEVEVTYSRKGSEKEATAVLGKKPGFSWRTKKADAPETLKWIDEDGTNAVIVDEDDDTGVLKIERAGEGELIELEKEFLIF